MITPVLLLSCITDVSGSITIDSLVVYPEMVRLDIVVLFALAIAPVLVAFEPNFPMETYTVNLDDPPSIRWNHILGDFNSSVPIILKYYYDTVRNHEAIIIIRT